MSAVDTTTTESRWATASGIRALFRERPIIPLLGLLALLVILSQLIRPGIVTPNWAGVMIRAAIPLAILAGCQTLTMLTGGIDLSVGAVASMTGFLVATLVGDTGLPVAILIALVVSALIGLVNGIGAGVFRVHPLIMTLAMSLVVLGLANVWQLIRVQTGSGVPPEFRTIGADLFGRGSVGSSMPSETTRSPPVCRAPSRGRC
jgi:ribose transport system permease protein